ncbi:MAG: sensor histidine kinase [Thermoflexales bacterium]
MNRLWARLALAFVAISLLTAGLAAALIVRNVNQQFRGYLVQPSVVLRGPVRAALEEHYAMYGSWENLDRTINQLRRVWMLRPGRILRGRPLLEDNIALVIADESGRVVFDEQGQQQNKRVPLEVIGRALPLVVEDRVVGYALTVAVTESVLGQPEQSFLDGVHNSILVAALISALAGVLSGAVISQMVARPLNRLAEAAHAFARREWGFRVQPERISGISELRDVALALDTMARSLQHSDQQRRNLMADIAHELRTPLAVIQGSLRALLDGVRPLSPNEIAAIYDETRLLARLVDDVRELSLAESHQLPLRVAVLDISDALREATERLQPVAEMQQVRLLLQLPDQRLGVHTDPDRLQQVVHNLVTNALRHTPAGGAVTLCAQSEGAMVRVVVHDTGSGIAPEDLPHVFDRFYRADRARTRGSGGSGLGLAIVKSLVQLMGGEVGVESALGRGSRFWFTLPRAEAAPPPTSLFTRPA